MAESNGSPWVEFVGGPYDGTMAQVRDASWIDHGGLLIFDKGERMPDGAYRRGPSRGHYINAGLLDEELGIVPMQWSHELPGDLRWNRSAGRLRYPGLTLAPAPARQSRRYAGQPRPG